MTSTHYVTLEAGADKGKVFGIDLLPAMRVEEFALRAYFLAMRAGVTLPDDLACAGITDLLQGDWTGLRAVSWDEVQPLLAEMTRCITYLPDPSRTDTARSLSLADIEAAGTMVALRMEWVKVHLAVLSSLRAVSLMPGIVTAPPVLSVVMPAGNA